MQVYSILNVLTARPRPERCRRAPHLLYGHVHPGTAYSTGAWLRDVMALMAERCAGAGPPVFVGGTGLYFRALVEGISEMPEIPQSVRERWRYELADKGATAAPHPDARRPGSRDDAARRATASASCGRWRCWRRRAARS